jgi:CBS domain containing-hemolysin-like protein
VFVVFLSAQITTYSTLSLPIPRWLFIFIIETGLPGVLVVLSFGQLMPQLVAATHPVTFMDIPGSWLVIKIALLFEALGITHFSWVLTFFTKWICRMDKGDNVTRNSLTRSRTKSRTKGRHSRSSRSRSKKK